MRSGLVAAVLAAALGASASPARAADSKTVSASAAAPSLPAAARVSVVAPDIGLAFINTAFENASPLSWEIDSNGTVQVFLVYDHERSSPNRAAGHWHFQLQGKPGSVFTIVINNLDNVWNGRAASAANARTISVVSADGHEWKPVPGRLLPGSRVEFRIEMPGPSLYVARAEPYRISDLERLLAEITTNRLVEVSTIGQTVEGRPLEIVRVGDVRAPHRVLLRARAHPWEPGGNWVVEGAIRRLLRGDDAARQYLARYCLYVLPMANKDGVARGRTRFNVLGKDLNRDWGTPADPQLVPENAALERWLETMRGRNQLPQLALELHNDDGGLFHVSRPSGPNAEAYLGRMKKLETLLRRHTWFTEGSTSPTFRNAGTLGEGLVERFGIDAAVHEFNANWIAGLNDYPSAKHWKEYGEGLCRVFFDYFGE